MSVLHVLRDPALDGPTNMARDEHLLHGQRLRPAVLRIYGWTPPTISLGCFQRHAELGRLPAELRDLAVVRRPTGGGAILHDQEVTYALVLDQTIPLSRSTPVTLYRLVHECWRDALAADGLACELAPDSLPLPSPRGGPFFCFQSPGRSDLLRDGQKLLGSAQRRVAGRVLQHGSLLLARRFASHPGADLAGPSPERVEQWVAVFIRRLAAALGLHDRSAAWTQAELAELMGRRERYASAKWTCHH